MEKLKARVLKQVLKPSTWVKGGRKLKKLQSSYVSVWGTWLEFVHVICYLPTFHFIFFFRAMGDHLKKKIIDINAPCCRHLDGDNALQGVLLPDAGDPGLDNRESPALLVLLHRLQAPSHRLSGARERGACKFTRTDALSNAHWAFSLNLNGNKN